MIPKNSFLLIDSATDTDDLTTGESVAQIRRLQWTTSN